MDSLTKAGRFDRRLSISDRRGAAHVMIAMMLLTFAVMSAFMIDYGYMQLVRGQTRMVADAAARAGAEALIRTRDVEFARQTAVTIAGRNEVAGEPFLLDPNDVLFGQSVPTSGGSWIFTPNVQPYNSVRVTPRVRSDAPFGAAPLFFGGVTGVDEFQTRSQATAGEQPVEICLCLDRSQSMIYQMNKSLSYPTSNPLLYPLSAFSPDKPLLAIRRIHSPPAPTESRWANLRTALNIFLTECGNAVNKPRVALVTFSSDWELTLYPRTKGEASSIDVPFQSVGTSWSATQKAINDALDFRSSWPLAGSTKTQAGLQASVDLMNGTTSSVQSRKVIIIFTDGVYDPDSDPTQAGRNAADSGITVHVVSLLTGYEPVLANIAATTGGKFYAPNTDASGNVQVAVTQLQQAFRDLAQQIPIVLME